MTLRVVQWSTGNVGRNAIAGIDARPDLELVGVWVSSADKVGKDAGELAGLGRTLGVAATNDADALLALKPDCVVYTAMADDRLPEAVEDLKRFLRAGVNVVSSSPVFLQFPDGVVPDEVSAPIRAAAAEGNASLWVNGVDPGFANDWLPLVLTGVCERIDEVRCLEILDYSTYDNANVLFDIMGFGKPMSEIPMLLQPGVLSLAWGSVVRQLAAGLGVELDAVEEHYERLAAPETFEIASGTIEEGRRRGPALRSARHAERPGGVRAGACDPPAARPRPGVAAAGRTGLLPGPGHRRTKLHLGPAAARRRR
jgi:4-hydroxy-tetrahydrodipicolinate reductase